MKALVIFHRVDYDGLFGNAIATKALKLKGYDVTNLGYNYNDVLPDVDFNTYDKIVLTDISLKPEMMKTLADNYSDKVIWIDHHVTAINDSKTYGYDKLEGVRVDGTAACELTYKYFFAEAVNEVPYCIRLVAANDVWDHDTFSWDDEVSPLQYGLGIDYKMNAKAVCDNLDDIIANVEAIKTLGIKVCEYMNGLYKNWCDRFAFEVTVAGKYRGIAMMSPQFGSKIFTPVYDKEYDVYVVVNKNANTDDFNISMYSDKPGIDFSCGEYMKANYNGGGHKGAAGGTITLGQFNKMITEKNV